MFVDLYSEHRFELCWVLQMYKLDGNVVGCNSEITLTSGDVDELHYAHGIWWTSY